MMKRKMEENKREEVEQEVVSDNVAESKVDENAGFDENQEDDKDRQLAELTEKLADFQDRYLRLSAEFDNYRKRTIKERYELVKTAGED
ncbi:MAG: nucleotide exchange factor GrpE, partial [Tannerella sp.]|nr:nucleotide exchange factor GrpE [Tannerella sp.]